MKMNVFSLHKINTVVTTFKLITVYIYNNDSLYNKKESYTRVLSLILNIH